MSDNGWHRRSKPQASSAQRGYDQAWRALRLLVLDRDGWTCRICGTDLMGLPPRQRQVDHITPAVQAPERRLDPSNLRAACAACNLKRGARLGRQRQRARPQRSSNTPYYGPTTTSRQW